MVSRAEARPGGGNEDDNTEQSSHATRPYHEAIAEGLNVAHSLGCQSGKSGALRRMVDLTN
jgi:hypothetical protein